MGLVLLFLRREALENSRVNAAVVALLWVTPLARVVSVVVDGVPHPMFVALMLVELAGAAVMSAYRAGRFTRPWSSVSAGLPASRA
jgi:hypothetical protein